MDIFFWTPIFGNFDLRALLRSEPNWQVFDLLCSLRYLSVSPYFTFTVLMPSNLTLIAIEFAYFYLIILTNSFAA